MNRLTFALMLVVSFFSQVKYSASSSTCANYGDNICTYTPSVAQRYARDYALETTSFPDYTEYEGNCTNFVSQAVLAGLIGSDNKYDVYNNRIYYMADYYKGCSYCWYFYNTSTRGAAFTQAHDLYVYAGSNLDEYWGMHFDFITKDSPTQYLDVMDVEVGDVIFADWDGNGIIDHSMLVTYINTSSSSYYRIYVSYQNSSDHDPQKDIPLGDINGTNIVFHVYRPTFYKNWFIVNLWFARISLYLSLLTKYLIN